MAIAFPNNSRFSSFRDTPYDLRLHSREVKTKTIERLNFCDQQKSPQYDPYSLFNKAKTSKRLFKGLTKEKESEEERNKNLEKDTYARFLNNKIEELRLVINESPLNKNKKMNSEKKIMGEKRKVKISQNEEGECSSNQLAKQKKIKEIPFKLEMQGRGKKSLMKGNCGRNSQSEVLMKLRQQNFV